MSIRCKILRQPLSGKFYQNAIPFPKNTATQMGGCVFCWRERFECVSNMPVACSSSSAHTGRFLYRIFPSPARENPMQANLSISAKATILSTTVGRIVALYSSFLSLQSSFKDPSTSLRCAQDNRMESWVRIRRGETQR